VRIQRKWRSLTDQDPVEQLAAQRSDHAFADRIRSWRSGWTGENLETVCGEDRVERPGEARIPVSEQAWTRLT
jgi:hypothetical protein